MKKIAIFAHFDKQNQVKAYVLTYLQAIAKLVEHIIVVSTAALPPLEQTKIQQLGCQLILRANQGHDFYSYKIGLAMLKDQEAELSQIILCNDSCFGPLFALEPIFTHMQQTTADFWGITANLRRGYHIQSYFMVFNKAVLISSEFKQFWQNLQVLANKDQIVSLYEVGLSRCLLAAGLTAASWVPSDTYTLGFWPLLKRKIRIFWAEKDQATSRYSWKNILEPLSRVDKSVSLFDYSICSYHMPFLKKSILEDHWLARPELYRIVAEYSAYPRHLIEEVINA